VAGRSGCLQGRAALAGRRIGGIWGRFGIGPGRLGSGRQGSFRRTRHIRDPGWLRMGGRRLLCSDTRRGKDFGIVCILSSLISCFIRKAILLVFYCTSARRRMTFGSSLLYTID